MPAEERTEQATPRRRARARRKGQVARSPDLSGALVMIAGLAAVGAFGPRVAQSGASTFRALLADTAHPASATTPASLNGILRSALSTVALAVAPVAAACTATGLLVGAAQAGIRPSPGALKPDFRRINPASGLRRLLGPNLAFEAAKAIGKVAVVGSFVALALLPGLGDLAAKVGLPPAQLGMLFDQRGLGIAERAASAYLVIGLLDYAWRRRRHEHNLRMTKQELKDETRQYGVAAEVKAALRRRQMQLARARMMAAVREADVVVSNPTHFAVALRYDGTRTAPEVVAKGQDLVALQIRRVAQESGVPVISDPPLARALHSSCRIGQVIPQELYAAVARVLALVYRMAGRRVPRPAAAGGSR